MVATLTTVKWSIDDYHPMVDMGTLGDRKAEILRGEIYDQP
ncbi:hypothetical protein [Leptolyngbya sp. PCC 6406]|nr:hypothetical protein [Leptolyngbya sp. PCC 6406]